MMPASPGVKLTYDDFVLFPDDGKRHELIDGEHYVSPSPDTKHQRIVRNLCVLIGTFLNARPIGEVFVAPFDVVLTDFDVVEPDVLYLSNQRKAAVLTPKHVHGAPELMVETGSEGTRKRDETLKHRLYERCGVDEYWLVDPGLDTIKIFRRVADRYRRTAELTLEAGDTLATPLLPGLEMSLADIFNEP